MTITYNLHSREGASLLLTLPEPTRIPIPAVREAVEKFAKRAAQHREASAALRAADSAVDRARAEIDAEAADAAEDGGTVPAKKLVKKLRAAQDALEEARIEFDARDTALRKAHTRVVETIRHHAPAWRAEVMGLADAAILRVTSARETLRKAGVELDESISTLGLLDRLTDGARMRGRSVPMTDGIPALLPLDVSAAYVGEALDRIGIAIGEAMETLDVQRGAERSTPDVVVPVAGEDQADEPPASEPAALGDMTIGADDE
ncbi:MULTISPECIES: hypothetical protein [unclassified Microbacterium]|uniref:hypothetical protein n=1 Tax=unclassified Microbacterium TaxID=2609290 RepID=UPI0012F9D7A1|nr:hypothetical protein [Microbacterium sp. MAH-37]MVQ42959.1 hypothetical protein [Microbacterium sp. MAH-37]